MFSDQQTQCLRYLGNLAQQHAVKLFLVGGAVRDILRGESFQDNDLDILVEGDARDFATYAKNNLGGSLKKFDRFFTAKLIKPTTFSTIEEIDFASARTEIYQAPGALPAVKLAPLSEDLQRRDFSINAIALPITLFSQLADSQLLDRKQIVSALIDPFGGRQDLEKKLIRILHTQSFRDDPTRMYRALRYVVRIGGALDESTKQAFSHAIKHEYLSVISLKRRFNELVKMVAEAQAARVIEQAAQTGLIKCTFTSGTVDIEKFSNTLKRVLVCPSEERYTTLESAEKLLLFTLLASVQVALQPQLFQGFSISRKTLKHFQSEWNSLLLANQSTSCSREAQAVFKAVIA